MPMYLVLYTYTAEGIKTIKESPARIQETIKAAEAKGHKVHNVFLSMGKYDLVAIVESPDDESAMAALMTQAMRGTVRTKTYKLFSLETFDRIIAQLP